MPALGYRVERPVRADPGKESHDFSNRKAGGRITHHEPALLDALPARLRCVIRHAAVPLVKVSEQLHPEAGPALPRQRSTRAIAQPVIRKALCHFGPIPERSETLHMVPQAPGLEKRFRTAVLFEEIEGVCLEKDQASDA